MDIERLRYLMIEQQIRPWNVLDTEILALLSTVKREEFVPAEHRMRAFVDTELPLPCGQCMLPPRLEARMLQEVNPSPSDDVLEIGAGSGYMAALLAHRARQVTTVDIHPELAALARANLARANILNAHVAEGDAMQGWGKQDYDVIVVSGSVEVVPQSLLAQLKPKGRLIAVVGTQPVLNCELITRVGTGFERKRLFETTATPMQNAPKAPAFAF